MAAALALAAGLPGVARASECPSIGVVCGLDIIGKRYVGGQETSVRCRARDGHTANFNPVGGVGDVPLLLLDIDADDPACDAVQKDTLRAIDEPAESLVTPRVERPGQAVFLGGAARLTNSTGRPQSECLVALTNYYPQGIDREVGGSGVSADAHGSLTGELRIGQLEPSVFGVQGGKADVTYFRRFVDGDVAFVGSIKLTDCEPDRRPE